MIGRLRAALRPILLPLRRRSGVIGTTRRRIVFLRYGIDGIAMELRNPVTDQVPILRDYGAHVGKIVGFPGPITVINARDDFSHLSIGDHCHIGSDVMFDLADRITVEDYAMIGMRSIIITHIDYVGPLAETHPRQTGPVHIGRGAYVGGGVTILRGVTIGAEAIVGANALVDRDVPPGATVVSPRAMPLPTSANEQ
jgi:acetyltransferase-like isoleucine patch superfamily enzyme